jgi:hypothetical protein
MPSRPDPLFAIAERLILSLYDGGVLSPAVLERVIASIGDIRWNTSSDARAKDDRALQEVVVAVMMPGNALDNVEQDFAAVIGHIVGAAKTPARPVSGGGGKRTAAGSRRGSAAQPAENTDDAESELLEQLARTHGASNKRTKPARTARDTRTVAGFNPLQNATPPKKA